MAPGEMDGIVDHLRGIALQQAGAPTDGQLLEAFVARRDGPSFEALVRRHGPMVLGVCRRVVGNVHDADDAFQATFLVLVRKAGAVVPRESIGNWLYGVAYRTALKARALTGRRRNLERRMLAARHSEATQDQQVELLLLLDRELERLPAKYRLPVILCDLECRTRRDAARQLGLPTGTLSGRLTTARRLLAKRLARHGLAVTGTALGAALGTQAAAAVPNEIVFSTVKAAALFSAGWAAAAVVPGKAAALAEGVLKTMLLTKLKIASAVLASIVVIAAGVLAYGGAGPGPAQSPNAASGQAPPKPGSNDVDKGKPEIDALRQRVLVEETKLKQATVALEQAKASLEQAKALLQVAQAEYNAARLRAEKAQSEPATPADKPGLTRAVLELRGSLRAAWVVQITPGVAGKVTEVRVQEGDLVQAGQLLATLDERSLLAERDRAKANYEVALARLSEAMAGEADQDPKAKARTNVANAELKRAAAELQLAEKQIEQTQIRSPVAGLVASRRVEVGDTVNPGKGETSASRLFELIDPRLHTVSVPVPERDISKVFVGQKVRVEADALPGNPVAGDVARIAPVADPATATIAIQVKLRTPAGDTLWKPGMSVTVAFLPKK
jgi:RND family efflux transporter MFP subunit